MQKVCSRCKVGKPFAEFAKCSARPDGLQYTCRSCSHEQYLERIASPDRKARKMAQDRISAMALYNRKKDDRPFRLAERERYRNADQGAKDRRNSRERQRYRRDRALGKPRRQQDPYKRRSRELAVYAVLRGDLVRPDRCSECGWIGKPDMHHPDYSKPLHVLWLCRICHGKEHRKD